MKSIDYREISGFSRLFLDYIYEYDRLNGFFTGDPAKRESWESVFSNLDTRNFQRKKLKIILEKQNRKCGDQKLLSAQLKKLDDPRCTVVITGQQAGLFLGPLYTVYKAQTALRLAEHLENEFDRPVVPVFWMEVDDHDFDEVRSFYLISPKGEVKRFRYTDGDEDRAIPVKNRIITASISPLFDELGTLFGMADNAVQAIESMRGSNIVGQSFPDVFIRSYRSCFPDQPLLFINPGAADFKHLAKPFFKWALMNHDSVKEALITQTKRLEKGAYEVQVSLQKNDMHLFHVPEDERVRLKSGTIFDNTRLSSAMRESNISEFVEENAEVLSPDVLLRPLLQDYLLPTAAYVAGPSEISYFAQLKELYSLLEIEMPMVFPRWSGSIIDKKSLKFLKSANIAPEQLIKGVSDDLIPQSSGITSGLNYDSLFHNCSGKLHDSMDELRYHAANLDKTLLNMIDLSEKKMQYQIGKIHSRFQAVLQSQDKINLDRSKRVQSILRPVNMLQERAFPIMNFLMRYGSDFSQFIVENISIETGGHHLLEYQ